MLTWAISGIFAAPLVVRWGFRRTALLGSCLIVVGFSGLLQCARHETSHWMLTAVLAITGLGFGPASMSYLLAAQDVGPVAAAGDRHQQRAVLPHDRRGGGDRPVRGRCSIC